MKLSSSCVRAVATGALLGGLLGPAHTTVFIQGKNAATVKAEPPIKPVVLPDRSQTLAVDWVDTKNARLSIGGMTYGVRRAVPKIDLVGGTTVNDIGYLKQGTLVKIQLQTDAQGLVHLTGVHVVSAATPPVNGGGAGAQGSGGGTAAPSGSGTAVTKK